MVELAVGAGSLSTKKTLFPLLDRHEQTGERPLPHIVIDAALLVALASLALAAAVHARGRPAAGEPDAARQPASPCSCLRR